jgi:hypothetical protein
MIPSVARSPLGCIQMEGNILRNSKRLFSSGSSAQQLITCNRGHIEPEKIFFGRINDRSSRARPGFGFSFRPAIPPELDSMLFDQGSGMLGLCTVSAEILPRFYLRPPNSPARNGIQAPPEPGSIAIPCTPGRLPPGPVEILFQYLILYRKNWPDFLKQDS